MKRTKRLTALLALVLAMGTLLTVLAEEEIFAGPVEGAIEEIHADLPVSKDEDAWTELAPEASLAVASAVTDAGSMVTITKPSDGETVKTGNVALWCRFSNAGFSGAADSWKLMPMTVEVLQNGAVVDTKSISGYGEFSFSDEGRQYANLKLADPGVYTIRVSVPGSPDKWSSVTVTVTDGPLPTATPAPPSSPAPKNTPVPDEVNPGFWFIPDQTEYTVEMGGTNLLRVYYTKRMLYRYETQGFSWNVDNSAILCVKETGYEEGEEKVDGLWQRRAYLDVQLKKPGTTTISTYVYRYDSRNNKIPYSLRNVTLHVLPDPNATPTPTPTPTPTVTPTATPEPVSVKGAKVTLEKSAYTYTGKALKPAVTVSLNGKKLLAGTDYTVAYKNNTKPGKATVTVKGIGGYAGTAKATFAIKPKKVKGLSVTAGVKRLTVKWTEDSTISGYEIQYSSKKSFSGAKTVTARKGTSKKVVKKLKAGKTYYVRIRSYKTVGETKYRSKWSAYKKVRVK